MTYEKLSSVFSNAIENEHAAMERGMVPDDSRLSGIISDLSTNPDRERVLKKWLPTFLASFDSIMRDFNAEILGANLHACRWQSWDSSEVQELESAFREMWVSLLDDSHNPRALDDFLCFRAMAGGSIQWYLESGGQVLLDALAEHNSFDWRSPSLSIELKNPWWKERQFQRDELSNWVQSMRERRSSG